MYLFFFLGHNHGAVADLIPLRCFVCLAEAMHLNFDETVLPQLGDVVDDHRWIGGGGVAAAAASVQIAVLLLCLGPAAEIISIGIGCLLCTVMLLRLLRPVSFLVQVWPVLLFQLLVFVNVPVQFLCFDRLGCDHKCNGHEGRGCTASDHTCNI